MYSINSIGRYIADKFVIYLDDEELEKESLIDGIILNTKLLTNDKMEYNNLLEIYRKRLDVIYNGNSKLSKVLNSNGFISKNNEMPLVKIINGKTYHSTLRQYSRDISKIVTSLFMYQKDNKTYNGLEITEKNGLTNYVSGTALNDVVNETYTLMMLYSRIYNPKISPNDIINKDMRENLKNDPKLHSNNYLKMFNLVRMLLVASENKPTTNYSKLIKEGKSIVNYKTYNNCGDKVVSNDLLYAGKYGMAASKYHENFDNIISYHGAFGCLLNLYDEVLEDYKSGNKPDKNTIKRIIAIIYDYYGSRYLLLQKTNAFSDKELELYKSKVKNSIDIVCKEYGIKLSPEDIAHKSGEENAIERVNYSKYNYHRLTEVKETFEVQDEVPEIAKKKTKSLLKEFKLK